LEVKLPSTSNKNTGTWPDEMVRLLSDDPPRPEREPNALDAAASVAMMIAEYASYAIIFGAIVAAWFLTPAGMQ